MLKIPVLPISYARCAAVARALTAAAWRRRRGAARCRSPITSARAPAQVHLTVESDWILKTIYNVVAVMHRRSDVPTSGSCAAIIMTAGCSAPSIRGGHGRDDGGGKSDRRAASRTAGGRSARSSMPSWDGEEPVLLGSTEWAEAHAAECKESSALREFRRKRAVFSSLRAAIRCSVSSTTSRPASTIPKPAPRCWRGGARGSGRRKRKGRDRGVKKFAKKSADGDVPGYKPSARARTSRRSCSIWVSRR